MPKRKGRETPQQAIRAFKAALLELEGLFFETRHFKERMTERRFTMGDVQHLAREGRILNPPEEDIAHGELKWRIEGRALDGRTVYVVFSILEEKKVKGITIETPGG